MAHSILRFSVLLTGLLLAACGGDDSAGPSTEYVAVGSGGAIGIAGAPGAGAPGSGGTGGQSFGTVPACAGAWVAAPTVLLQFPPRLNIGSLTLSPDELEIFYMWAVTGGVAHIRRAVRSSKTAPFPEGIDVPELDAACASPTDGRNVDLSSDGLRLYMVCFPLEGPTSGLLRIARRPTLAAPFALDPPTSTTVGLSVAIGKDELTLYSTSIDRRGSLVYERSSIAVPFGPGKPVPGLESSMLINLDPAPDGLSILAGLDSNIVTASRTAPSGAFGMPTPLVLAEDQHLLGSPEVSQDCRTLYYVDIDATSSQGGESIRAIGR